MPHLDEGTLHTYLDGELEGAELIDVGEHLATCAECRGRLDAARAARTRAHEILRYADPPAVEMPDFATLRTRRAARAAPATAASGSRARPILLPWAASVVLALGVGWFAQSLLSPGGEAGRVAVDAAAPRDAEVAETSRTAAPEGFADRPGEPDVVAQDASEAPTAMRSLPPPESGQAERPAAATGAAAAAPSPQPSEEASSPTPTVALSAEAAPPPAPARRRLEGGAPSVAAERIPAADLAAERDDPRTKVAPETVGSLGYVQAQGAEVHRAAESEGAASRSLPAPTAHPLAAAVAAAPPSNLAAAEVAWVLTDAATAARALDRPPSVIRGLPVVSHALAPRLPGMVRVIQRLPGGELLEIYQGGGREAELVVRGGLEADSLEKLREMVGEW